MEFMDEAGDTYINEEKGYGLYKWSDINTESVEYRIYLGQFKDGKREGEATWFDVEGYDDIGNLEWKNDIPDGKFELFRKDPTVVDVMRRKSEYLTGNVVEGLYDGVIRHTAVDFYDHDQILSIQEVKYDHGIAIPIKVMELEPGEEQGHVMAGKGKDRKEVFYDYKYKFYYGLQADEQEINLRRVY